MVGMETVSFGALVVLRKSLREARADLRPWACNSRSIHKLPRQGHSLRRPRVLLKLQLIHQSLYFQTALFTTDIFLDALNPTRAYISLERN